MSDKFAPLYKLNWFRIHLRLKNVRYHKDFVKEHIVCQIRAFLEFVNNRPQIENMVFQLRKDQYALRLNFQGKILEVSVMLYARDEQVNQWMEGLHTHIQQKESRVNFELVDQPVVEKRSFDQLLAEKLLPEDCREVCLDFHMPLPLFDKQRTIFEKDQIIQALNYRCKRIFNIDGLTLGLDEATISTLSHTQQYTDEIRHNSRSQRGHEQWLKGYKGPLYIKGNLKAIWPLLVLGTEWNVGHQIADAMGHFSIYTNPIPFYDTLISNRDSLRHSIKQQCEESDYFQNYIEGFKNTGEALRNIEEEVFNILSTGKYIPGPTQLMELPKATGGKRTIELLPEKDEILQHFIFEQVTNSFDQLLRKEAIGFRKGHSRKNSIDMVQVAISEGFEYAIHTDIDDYFPSVLHERLLGILDSIIPLADAKFRNLLSSALKQPFNSANGIQVRSKGLPQGSSLSPLLANLYLDDFDDFIVGLPVRCIRYADDLLIMCRTEEEAMEILVTAENQINNWGLHFKKDKTFICKTTDTFQFLGIQFSNGKEEPEDQDYRLFKKKPVFVTEEYCYLAFHKDVLNIYKNKKLVSHAPISQISEIISHYQVALSGVLIGRCIEQGIPLTLTLSNAYHLTTIKPNSKKYHDIMTVHGIAYYNMSEAERVAMACLFVQAKFHNIIPLFRQRYAAGTGKIIQFLEDGIKKADEMDTVEQLRGQEGYLSKEFYQRFNDLVQVKAFEFKGRSREGNDPMNVLMNISSYLLMAKLNGIVRACGLNPYLGWLHSSGNSYESLVYDLMEVFRGRLYRFILKLINLKIVQVGDFEMKGERLYLNHDVRKKIIAQFEYELNAIDRKTKLTFREHIYAEVIKVKNWAMKDEPITPYQWHV
jgi:CRISPR-associated protein Cas1